MSLPDSPTQTGAAAKPLFRGVLVLICAVLLCGIAGVAGYQWAAWKIVSRGIHTDTAIRRTHSADRDAIAPPLTMVHALGRLEPRGTILHIAPSSGNEGARVARLEVREGDCVAAGDLLAELDNMDRRAASLREAETQVQLAATQLAQVRAGAKPAEIAAQLESAELFSEQIKVAERDLDRARQLQARNAITAEDLQNFQWALDRARLEHRRATKLLDAIRDIRATDVDVALHGVAVAEAGVERAKAELTASRVLAPAAGTILRIHTHAGERLGDQALLEMGDVRNMQAVAEVFESDVAPLRVGMLADVTLENGSRHLRGRIDEIGRMVARKTVLTNDPVSDTDARVVEVRISLNPADAAEVAGLSNARVEVSIRLESRESRRQSD